MPLFQTDQLTASQALFLRLRVFLAGLALDFWKDTPFPWDRWGLSSTAPIKNSDKETTDAPKPSDQAPDQYISDPTYTPSRPGAWTGDRIQVIEKMWGEGHNFPGNDRYINSLLAPLGLSEDKSVLDLSAGLGALGRKIAVDYGAYVTGCETDHSLAARGMIMSIAAGKAKMAPVSAYDPVGYKASRKYDCILARELFFRVLGKEKFFTAIASSLKSGGGQLIFTDYILDSTVKENTAVRSWLNKERSALPLSSVDMIKAWKSVGLDVRVAEDQTSLYRREILKGLMNLLHFMSNNPPDYFTRSFIAQEVDLWATRVAAFDQGLKYYRFSAIK